jgi:hypothetical protein
LVEIADTGTSKRFVDSRTSGILALALVLSVGAVEFGAVGTDFVGLGKYPIGGSGAGKEHCIW